MHRQFELLTWKRPFYEGLIITIIIIIPIIIIIIIIELLICVSVV